MSRSFANEQKRPPSATSGHWRTSNLFWKYIVNHSTNALAEASSDQRTPGKRDTNSWKELVGACAGAPLFYFLKDHESLIRWEPLMHILAISLGCIGFFLLIGWNGVLRKRSFVHINAFLAFWMIVYFILMVLFPK
jgi:hypothetical protein